MIIYCTNDSLSAHTAKRKAYFDYYSIPSSVVGIANLSNRDTEITIENIYKTHNGNPFKYVQRLIFAYRVLKRLDLSKGDVVILRGWEFVCLKWIILNRVFVEITDIPNAVLKWSILRSIFKLIHAKSTLLLTSLEFNSTFKSDKCYLWHNVSYPITMNLKKTPMAFENDRILYAGYLRGISDLLKNASWIYDQVDFYGKMNIIGGEANLIINENYFGEYQYKEMNALYYNYRYGYISDFFGFNSSLNLTNRIYEVILNYALPVHIKSDSTARFLKKHNLFYIASFREFQETLKLSQEEFISLVKQNKRRLLNAIRVDNTVFNEVVNFN